MFTVDHEKPWLYLNDRQAERETEGRRVNEGGRMIEGERKTEEDDHHDL